MVATSPNGSLLTIQLGDSSQGFILGPTTGLDPVKASITSSPFAGQDGAQFQAASRPTRNIVMQIDLLPTAGVNTVRSLRQQLYNFFVPKSLVSLKFYVDDTDDSTEDGYFIQGYVEYCTSEMFATSSGYPAVHLSIICMTPDFIDPVPVTVSTLTTADTTATYFPYAGSVETGVTVTLNVNRTLSEFVLYYVDANQTVWTMDVQASLLAGDVVTINTTPGNKYINLTRSGVVTSLAYAVPLQATWPIFAPGDNWLRVYASGAAIPASVTYTKRFGGL